MNNRPIRVLHVLGSTEKGGAQALIMNVYRNIDRSKIQFDFMVHTKEKNAYDDEIAGLGGQIYRVPAYKVANHLKYKDAWRKFFKINNHAIIHGHMTSTASIYFKIAQQNRTATIAHSHNTLSGKGPAALVKDILQFPLKNIADYLFACSAAAGRWCYGVDSCKKSNFRVLQNAIDTDKFVYRQTISESKRKELNIEDKFVVGHIGRFAPQKNHTFLIDIFKEIYNKNSNAVLLLIGGGELRNEIEAKVRALDLNDSVIFTGERSDISDLLCAMDVFLLPSLWEGLPVTLIEAQANGLHCVISDTTTQDVALTNLIEYAPLKESASYWADKVLAYTKGYERKNLQNEITRAGFDIKEVAAWLENFYCEVV